MPNKTIVAIVVIGALLGVALWQGTDGALLASGLVVIAGLGGFAAGKKSSS